MPSGSSFVRFTFSLGPAVGPSGGVQGGGDGADLFRYLRIMPEGEALAVPLLHRAPPVCELPFEAPRLCVEAHEIQKEFPRVHCAPSTRPGGRGAEKRPGPSRQALPPPLGGGEAGTVDRPSRPHLAEERHEKWIGHLASRRSRKAAREKLVPLNPRYRVFCHTYFFSRTRLPMMPSGLYIMTRISMVA
jgi:hypothetical protein